LFERAHHRRIASVQGMPDIYAACAVIKAKGGNSVIAFVIDPDGYKIELIERQV
jgi:lactoylglutathione lyase